MGLERVGPVLLDHRNPRLTWTSGGTSAARTCSIDGQSSVASVQQLSELFANPDRRITVGEHKGVLEHFALTGDLVGSFRGWYLVELATDSAERPWSVTPFTPFTLSAAYLRGRVVIARSARMRPNDLGLAAATVVVDPLGMDASVSNPFAVTPGGNWFVRGYETDAGTNALVGMYAGLVSALGTDLQPIVLPAATEPLDFGATARAYDRRLGRNVHGPHAFAKPSDIELRNGLLRVRVGPAGVPAHLALQAWTGSWVDVGVLSLAEDALLLAADLTRVRPDEATVTLLVRDQGEVVVSLRMGERMVRVRHGSDRQPLVTASRVVGWRGMPPTRQLTGAANGTGRYGRGLTATLAEWHWPGARGSWAVSGVWLPTSGSTAQADSGLVTLVAANGDTSRLRWDAATDTVKWDHDGGTLSTPLLTFAAAAPVSWAIGYDGSTARLVVRVGSTTHTTSAAEGPGTTAANWTSMLVGVATSGFGLAAFGSGSFGGSSPTTALGGVLDNLMVFEDALSDADATTLLASSTALGGLPSVPARMIWHAAFDADAVPLGSAMAGGRRYQATVEGGATRDADDNGLTKGLCVLRSVVTARSPFGVILPGTTLEVGAYLATTNTKDDLADHHDQFAAATEQSLRVR